MGGSNVEEQRADERRAMVEQIRAHARETAFRTGRGEIAPRVLEAMARVPRHVFVPDLEQHRAYADAALPIGSGQTISQPYVVALMTDLAEVGPGDRVLEVGTGCGYQTAVLAELARRVYTIEIVPELAREGRERLARLGYRNVEVREGDGSEGWPEHAPFDAVLVTAGAAGGVPPALVEQLRPGGRLVIPVGGSGFGQELILVEKDEDGTTHRRSVLPVAFVPLRRASAAGDA